MTCLEFTQRTPSQELRKARRKGSVAASQQSGTLPRTPPGRVGRSRPRPSILFSARRDVGSFGGRSLSSFLGLSSYLGARPGVRFFWKPMALNSVLKGSRAEKSPGDLEDLAQGGWNAEKEPEGLGGRARAKPSPSRRSLPPGSLREQSCTAPKPRRAAEPRGRSGPPRPPSPRGRAQRGREGQAPVFCPQELGFLVTRRNTRESSLPGQPPGRPALSLKVKGVGRGRGRGGAREGGRAGSASGQARAGGAERLQSPPRRGLVGSAAALALGNDPARRPSEHGAAERRGVLQPGAREGSAPECRGAAPALRGALRRGRCRRRCRGAPGPGGQTAWGTGS